MLINGAKCSTMHITACNKDQDFTNISARGTEIIAHVTAMKLLGVVIQYSLKWDQQIDSMVAKGIRRVLFDADSFYTHSISVCQAHTLIRHVLFDADSFYAHSISVCQAHTPIRRVLFDADSFYTHSISVCQAHTLIRRVLFDADSFYTHSISVCQAHTNTPCAV